MQELGVRDLTPQSMLVPTTAMHCLGHVSPATTPLKPDFILLLLPCYSLNIFSEAAVFLFLEGNKVEALDEYQRCVGKQESSKGRHGESRSLNHCTAPRPAIDDYSTVPNRLWEPG